MVECARNDDYANVGALKLVVKLLKSKRYVTQIEMSSAAAQAQKSLLARASLFLWLAVFVKYNIYNSILNKLAI